MRTSHSPASQISERSSENNMFLCKVKLNPRHGWLPEFIAAWRVDPQTKFMFCSVSFRCVIQFVKAYPEQECIPVGCVPAAHWPYTGVCFRGGGCLLRGGLLRGVSALVGVSSGGVSALGVCLLWAGVCFGGVCSRGCLLQGGVCSWGGCGIPACTEADTPLPREQNDRQV